MNDGQVVGGPAAQVFMNSSRMNFTKIHSQVECRGMNVPKGSQHVNKRAGDVFCVSMVLFKSIYSMLAMIYDYDYDNYIVFKLWISAWYTLWFSIRIYDG